MTLCSLMPSGFQPSPSSLCFTATANILPNRPMSSNMSVAELGELTLALEQQWQGNMCIVSTTVVLLYDWLISVGREVDVVWTRKMNVAGVLYVSARVIAPLGHIAAIVLINSVDEQVRVMASCIRSM
ncbi:hypothetical protein BC628DRAFT_848904 [Trametes gibbosa]|nr:hypothetical protein BC628DRAFT_848904 [Trametes gibbosa]